MYDTLTQPAMDIPFNQPTTSPNEFHSALKTAIDDAGYETVPAPEAPAELSVAEPIANPELYAYVKEIVPSGAFDTESGELHFDVILNVSSGGCNSTIVKKISFCKQQLAKDLLNAKGQPTTMVEEVKPTGQSDTAKRLRALYTY
jgi:hypothetical protein